MDEQFGENYLKTGENFGKIDKTNFLVDGLHLLSIFLNLLALNCSIGPYFYWPLLAPNGSKCPYWLEWPSEVIKSWVEGSP